MSNQETLQAIEEVIVTNIEDRIKEYLPSIPGIIKEDLKSSRNSFIKEAANTFDKAEDILKQPYVQIQGHIDDYNSWLMDPICGHLAFETDLINFFTNLWEVPKHVGKVLDIHFDSEKVEIEQVIRNIPTFLLYIISKGLKTFEVKDGVPKWLSQSKKIKELAENIVTKEELKNLIDNKDKSLKIIASDMKELKLILKIFNPTLELVKSFCPEDLSINLDILGEGGGTEVAGHPVKIPFNVITWISAMADVACDEILEMISDGSDKD